MSRARIAQHAITFVAALGALLVLALLFGRYLDAVRFGHGTLLDIFVPGSGNSARYALTASVAALATTLGILMGWVVLSVNTTATRYSLRMVDRFTRSRATTFMGALFIGTILYCIWVELTIEDDFIPRWGLLSGLGLVTLCLGLLGPYFYYLLALLQPGRLVDELAADLHAALRPGHAPADNSAAGAGVSAGLTQLAEIGLNAVQTNDGELARRAARAIAQVLVAYERQKHALAAGWQQPATPSDGERPTYHGEVVQSDPSAWLEEVGLRELSRVFDVCLGRAPDVAGAVAQGVQQLGTTALDVDDVVVAGRVTSYLNSYLRSCLNRRDVSTAYNLLQQYRLLAEAALARAPALAADITGYFAYYGRQAESMGLDWVAVTAAYDLRILCQQACEAGADHQALLGAYERLVHPLAGRSPALCRELAKSVALLASFYAVTGDGERVARLERVLATADDSLRAEARAELLAVGGPAYWEVTQRGINFDYAPPAQQAALEQLLGEQPMPGDSAR
jgi:hypothetical protein